MCFIENLHEYDTAAHEMRGDVDREVSDVAADDTV